ncbi:hypothetical protein [Armatimonas sp.]|uniref:hypothetical protein n=1 Tax=Armatimonas sp. TaxID=1872638 RepID=UPI00286AD227|nr:hypothetical protein [Armatimonas sp.]
MTQTRKLGLGLAGGLLAGLMVLPQTSWLLRALLQGIVAAALWQPAPPLTVAGSVTSGSLLLLATWALVALVGTTLCGGVAGVVLSRPSLWVGTSPRASVQAALLLLLVGSAAWWGAGAAQLIGGSRLEGGLSGVLLLFPLAAGMLALVVNGRRRGEAPATSVLTGLAALSLPVAFSLSLLCTCLLLVVARP